MYAKPYKLRAGALALAVHCAFFALLYFGASWKAQPPQGMVVDIWDGLPGVETAPVKIEASKAIEQPELGKPVAPPKADIELSEKKRPQEKSKPIKIEPKRQTKKVDVQVEKKIIAEQKVRAERERVRTELASVLAKTRRNVKAESEKAVPSKVVEPVKPLASLKADLELAEKKRLREKSQETVKPEPKRQIEKMDTQSKLKAEAEQKAEAEAEQKAEAEAEQKAEAKRKMLAEQKAETEQKAEAKKKALAEKRAQAEEKERAKQKAQAEQKLLAEKEQAELKAQAEQKAKVEQERARAEQKAQAEQDRVRAAQAAAIGKEVAEYTAKIKAKIRRNIVMLPDIPYNVTAEFYVTLLPGGMVLKSELTKPSGSAAYDSAVERAIKKAQPLPLPPDVTLFDKFRELRLTVTPIKE